MSRPRSPLPARRRRVTAVLAAIVLAALGLMAPGIGTTEASWQEDERGQATFTAGVLNPPVQATCTFSGASFTPGWIAPAEPSVAPAGYQYRITFTPLLGVETLVQDWTDTTPAGAPQFTFAPEPALLKVGEYRFQVRAVAGDWTSDPLTGTSPVLVLLVLPVINGCSWQ